MQSAIHYTWQFKPVIPKKVLIKNTFRFLEVPIENFNIKYSDLEVANMCTKTY